MNPISFHLDSDLLTFDVLFDLIYIFHILVIIISIVLCLSYPMVLFIDGYSLFGGQYSTLVSPFKALTFSKFDFSFLTLLSYIFPLFGRQYIIFFYLVIFVCAYILLFIIIYHSLFRVWPFHNCLFVCAFVGINIRVEAIHFYFYISQWYS